MMNLIPTQVYNALDAVLTEAEIVYERHGGLYSLLNLKPLQNRVEEIVRKNLPNLEPRCYTGKLNYVALVKPIQLREENKTFIDGLASRLLVDVMAPTYGGGTVSAKDYNKSESLDEEELAKLLDIVNEEGLLLMPFNTSMGFAIGFYVATVLPIHPGLAPEVDTLIQFREDQLPEGHTFDTLKSYFLAAQNVGLAHYIGEDIKPDRVHYDY